METTFDKRSAAATEFSRFLAAGWEALDLLNIGVVVTDVSRQLLFANDTADQILLARDGLEVSREGVLVSLNQRSNPSLKELVQQMAQASLEQQEARDAVLAVQRPSGRRPLSMLLRPLRSSPWCSHAPVAAILFFLSDPELPLRDTETRLRQLYGLTSCEAHLANLLMEGKTLQECCDHLDIRISTGRMHLGNLFAKTGVQRQSQLVSLLWRSVGMIRTKGGLTPSAVCTEIATVSRLSGGKHIYA